MIHKDSTANKTPRPSSTDKTIVRLATDDFSKEIHKYYPQQSCEEWQRDLYCVYHPASDGYEMAKELEEKGYSPDSQMVELLENYHSHISSHHTKAIKQWVKYENITLSYKVGDNVEAKWGRDNIKGEITELLPETAEYLVQVDKNSSSRCVVKSENVLSLIK